MPTVQVLGEVTHPNTYPIDANTTVLDVLALAGGRTYWGDEYIYILRQQPSGSVERINIDLRHDGIKIHDEALAERPLRDGDRIIVPEAAHYYMQGNVRKPANYRLDAGLTIQSAIELAGGITFKGSIEIKRRKPNGDYQILSGKLSDQIQPGDIITIRSDF